MQFHRLQRTMESPSEEPAVEMAPASPGTQGPFAQTAAAPAGAGQPTLTTLRLTLRPYTFADASAVAALAGRREIADTTMAIPHPYLVQHATDWISGQSISWKEGREVVFAIVFREETKLIGAVGLREIDKAHSHAELGYWIGVDWWGRGFATEAARAVVEFGFQSLKLNRIHAHHMLRNPASGRVLQKVGMRPEGVLRQRVCKWGVFEDVAILAVIKSEWQPLKPL